MAVQDADLFAAPFNCNLINGMLPPLFATFCPATPGGGALLLEAAVDLCFRSLETFLNSATCLISLLLPLSSAGFFSDDLDEELDFEELVLPELEDLLDELDDEPELLSAPGGEDSSCTSVIIAGTAVTVPRLISGELPEVIDNELLSSRVNLSGDEASLSWSSIIGCSGPSFP